MNDMMRTEAELGLRVTGRFIIFKLAQLTSQDRYMITPVGYIENQNTKALDDVDRIISGKFRRDSTEFIVSVPFGESASASLQARADELIAEAEEELTKYRGK